MEHIYWYYRIQTSLWMRRHRVNTWYLAPMTDTELAYAGGK